MGKPRNTRKYLTYPEIPEIPENTRKNKKIPGNTRSYFSTLLPDPNPTRYPVFCPIPDPKISTVLYVPSPYPARGKMLFPQHWRPACNGVRKIQIEQKLRRNGGWVMQGWDYALAAVRSKGRTADYHPSYACTQYYNHSLIISQTSIYDHFFYSADE